MNAEQIQRYKELCKQNEARTIMGFVCTELDEMMALHNWKTLYNQLDRGDRKVIRAYKIYKQDTSWGFAECHVKTLEAVVQRLAGLKQLEDNARWIVRNRRTGLSWATVIEPPYWRPKQVAFLFAEQQAKHWAAKFNIASKSFDFEAVKIDATKRLSK